MRLESAVFFAIVMTPVSGRIVFFVSFVAFVAMSRAFAVTATAIRTSYKTDSALPG